MRRIQRLFKKIFKTKDAIFFFEKNSFNLEDHSTFCTAPDRRSTEPEGEEAEGLHAVLGSEFEEQEFGGCTSSGASSLGQVSEVPHVAAVLGERSVSTVEIGQPSAHALNLHKGEVSLITVENGQVLAVRSGIAERAGDEEGQSLFFRSQQCASKKHEFVSFVSSRNASFSLCFCSLAVRCVGWASVWGRGSRGCCTVLSWLWFVWEREHV